MSIANKTRLLVALFLILDLVFLRWVWIHFFNWGFWDWDYQHTLLEATRVSFVDYFQVPLWNPYIGGGATLAGNSLNHAWAPCFLPVLLLGTLSGAKICIFIYLLIGQLGMYLLARHRGLSMQASFFSAIICFMRSCRNSSFSSATGSKAGSKNISGCSSTFPPLADSSPPKPSFS